MTEPSTDKLLEQAMQHHRAGQLTQAEAAYRQVLAQRPDNDAALAMLGTLCHQLSRNDEGIELLKRSTVVNPLSPEGFANLGAVQLALGKYDESIASSRRAIELAPNTPHGYGNLAAALYHLGRYAEAEQIYRRVLQLNARDAEALYRLGMTLRQLGNTEEAIRAIATAVAYRTDVPEWHFQLGVALLDRGHFADAAEAFRTVTAMQPNRPDAHNFLGITYSERAMIDDAIACYRKAIELLPNFGGAYNNLANGLKETGRVVEAIPMYRKAAELQPDSRITGNMLYTMHFDANYSARQLFEEHVAWDKEYAQPLKAGIRPFSNDRSLDRKLKVGFVGQDLREHPIGRFLLPLLAHRDRNQFEIHCFTDLQRPDPMTQQLQQNSERWHPTSTLNDAALAELIRKEQIDILVDLSMHMDGTRLMTFARKPAPMQITYLAYCSTTGLSTMDYRISDPYLDPPDGDDSVYTEKTLRLPTTYWCYSAPQYQLDIPALPASINGFITFAALNNFGKVTPQTLQTWMRILNALPGSRILIHVGEGSHRNAILQQFRTAGVERERVEFIGRIRIEEYLNQYKRADIALDPFPYVGGTTTCDALWMGVPVVTRSGQTAVSRGGVSILTNVGLPELIANDTENYIRLVTDLANDKPRLTQLRTTLRERLRTSPVMDAQRFARDFEALLRQAWKMSMAK